MVHHLCSLAFFTGKELALAFGITITFSRIGSVLNFFVSTKLVEDLGYKTVLWIGFISPFTSPPIIIYTVVTIKVSVLLASLFSAELCTGSWK